MILYVSGDRQVDFVGLYMKDGQVHFAFNTGNGVTKVSSPRTYDDGQWHTVSLNFFFKKNHSLSRQYEITGYILFRTWHLESSLEPMP